jgi:hypothetical protein
MLEMLTKASIEIAILLYIEPGGLNNPGLTALPKHHLFG